MSDRRSLIMQKIARRLRIDPVTGCHLWTGPDSGKTGRGKGYPRMCLEGRTVAVHIVVYTHYKGFVTPGKQIDHTCKRRICCNPDHLDLVTHKENQRRKKVPMKALIPLTIAALVSACHTGRAPVRQAEATTLICSSVPTHIRQTALGITELLDLANQSSVNGDAKGYNRQLSLATQYAQELGRLNVMDDICLQKGQYDLLIRSGLDPLSGRNRAVERIHTFSDRLLSKPVPGITVDVTTAWLDALEAL